MTLPPDNVVQGPWARPAPSKEGPLQELYNVQPTHEPASGYVVVPLAPGTEPLRFLPEGAIQLAGQLIAQAHIVQGKPIPNQLSLTWEGYTPPAPYTAGQPASNPT